jgi:DNA polymerase-1
MPQTRLKDFFFDFVMPLHDLYLEIENRGIKIDFKRRAELQDMYLAQWREKQAELDAIAGYNVNVLSNNKPKDKDKWGQVAKFLYLDLGIPEREAVDEETLASLLGNVIKDPKRRRAVELILEIRGIRKAFGYVMAPPDYDGRMRTSYRIVGTETGRTSTSTLKPPTRPEDCGLAFQTLSKRGDAGKEIRSMFIPDDGYIFLEADLSQAEARVVALLSNDNDTLKLFEMSDIHKLTAAVIFFNAPISNIKPDPEKLKLVQPLVDKVEKNTHRFVGKTSRHAYNYDMQKRRLMLTVNTDARKYHIPIDPISEWFAGKILKKLDELMPNVKGVFHEEVRRILAESRTLVNPFGRSRFFMGRWEPELFRTAYSNIPQSTVSDRNKMAMLNTRRRIPDPRVMQIMMESHDAFMVQCPEDKAQYVGSVMKEEMERAIDFTFCSIPRGELVIPCELQIGRKNYKELEPFTV